MNIIDIITKKKNKEELSYEEIKYTIDNFVNGEIADYQMSSFLMAVVINGMTDRETIDLTKIMLESGEQIDLSKISSMIVDKHSTGGVGDKTTLVLIPLVASTGICVAKMSGRGLGHTGGTIDKLEAIKGFKVNIEEKDFEKQVKDIGSGIVSQTNNLVPADKKIYALRDVTGTTESIPLIASSIMSKKIASGADVIVIDVKVGNGALMKNINDARLLATLMIKIGLSYNRKVVCVLSDMSEPLGNAIGNGLEVVESIESLKGHGPKDLEELVITLGTSMVSLGKNITKQEAKKELTENLHNGKAYKKFEELIKRQHGDINNIEVSKNVISIKSYKDGVITKIDTMKIGELVKQLGAGRNKKEDKIDYGVGIVLNKKIGDFVLENEELVKVYYNNKDINAKELIDCFTIENSLFDEHKLILEIIE